MKHQSCCRIALLISLCVCVSGLAPTISTQKHETEWEKKTEVYKIVGVLGGTQHLPASYVDTFSRWRINDSDQIIAVSSEECAFDKPNSNSTTISMQPTINFLLKSGVPSYMFVGLLVEEGKDKKTNHLAQQWTTFDTAAEPNFRVELFMGQVDGRNVQRLGVVDAKGIKQAVEQLGKALSTTGVEDLASGFHIIEFPLKMNMETLEMARGKGGTMMLTCLATSEPDAARLLRIEDKELEKTATSKLQVDAWRILGNV